MDTAPYTPEHLLAPLCHGWRGKIKRAIEHKQPFQDLADECMAFLCDSHDFLWDFQSKFRLVKGDDKDFQAPDFRMTTNKAHELRALFGPVLYARNPVRTVTPRVPFVPPQELMVNPQLSMQAQQMEQAVMAQPMLAQDPMFMGQLQQIHTMVQQQMMAYQQAVMQQQQTTAQDRTRADLLARYLNYTPNELDLAGNAQLMLTEALIKGAGVMWVEHKTPAGSQRRLVGSFYDTIDNLLIDPDAEQLSDAQWIARRCVHPYWEVEREYGLPTDSLKKYATLESGRAQGETQGDQFRNDKRNKGETNDLIVYWKIWSKMGMGGRMSGVPEAFKEPLEAFGDYCYLVVAEGCPFLLNLPDGKLEMAASDEELLPATAWPIETWRDDRWPMEMFWFYDKPRYVWPISPLAPGLGELKFINWCMSYLANRVKTSCRDFIAMAKSAAEEIREKILNGPDFTIIEVEASNGGINNVVQFLSQPQVNKDVWSVLSAVMEMFDKRVGLTELVYGLSARQMRSASEAQVKAEQVSVRPDYMAGQVEKGMSNLARIEAFAVRQLDGFDVQEIVGGPIGAQWWDALVKTQDLEQAAREFDVRIEAGSARRPNRERDIDNINTILPTLLPIYQAYGQTTGNFQPFNALMGQWCQVIEKDPTGLMLPDVQMMPPQPPPGEGQEEGSQENPQGQAA